MSNNSPDVQGFAFYGDGHETAKQTVKVIRTGLIIGALLSALFGVLILTATGQVREVVAVLFGIYFIVRGAIRLGTGFLSGAFGAAGRALRGAGPCRRRSAAPRRASPACSRARRRC